MSGAPCFVNKTLIQRTDFKKRPQTDQLWAHFVSEGLHKATSKQGRWREITAMRSRRGEQWFIFFQ